MPRWASMHGEHSVAGGVGVGAALPHGHVADARLVQRQVGSDVQVEGLERSAPASVIICPRCRQCAGRAANGHVVEAGLDVHRVAQTAEDLVSQHGGEYERRSTMPEPVEGRPLLPSPTATPRCCRWDGLTPVAGVAVVKVEVADGHAVGEGSQVEAGLLAAAHNGNRLAAGYQAGQLPGDPRWLAVIAAQSAAQGVYDEALGQVDGLLRQVVVTQRRSRSCSGSRPGWSCCAPPEFSLSLEVEGWGEGEVCEQDGV